MATAPCTGCLAAAFAAAASRATKSLCGRRRFSRTATTPCSMNTAACWAGSLRGCTGSRTRSSSGFSPARRRATSLWSSWIASSAPHGGRFDRQPVGAPHEEQLELQRRVGPVRWQLGVQAEHARPDPALERAHLLPLEAISRIAVRLPLAQRLGAQALAPVLLMAVRAGEIHLAAARVIRFSARVQLLSRGIDLDWHATRLMRDIGGEREQLVRLVREGLFVPDFGFQRDDPAVLHRRVARRHALHRDVTGRAFLREQLRPLVHPQHARVLRVARLQAAHFFACEFKAGAILRFRGARNQRREDEIFPHFNVSMKATASSISWSVRSGLPRYCGATAWRPSTRP